jgi:hypothetical protein
MEYDFIHNFITFNCVTSPKYFLIDFNTLKLTEQICKLIFYKIKIIRKSFLEI